MPPEKQNTTALALSMNYSHNTSSDASSPIEPRSSIQDSTTAVRPALTAATVSSDLDLQTLIHYALRTEHPEWVEPNGEPPMCDLYEARFAELLGIEPRRWA